MANRMNKFKKKEFRTKMMASLLVERLKENPFLIEEMEEVLTYLKIEVKNNQPLRPFMRPTLGVLCEDGKYRLPYKMTGRASRREYRFVNGKKRSQHEGGARVAQAKWLAARLA